MLLGAAAGGLWLAADWWICLPEGEMEAATYVGRDVCRPCHEEETEQWTGSDHDLAMDHATAETVLGDFNDSEFSHIAFDDVARLADRDVRTMIEQVDVGTLAIAMADLGEPIAAIIYTDISRDGMLAGPNFEAMAEMQGAVRVPVIASGGVATVDDVRELAQIGMAGCIIGRSLYEGTLSLAEAIRAARIQ